MKKLNIVSCIILMVVFLIGCSNSDIEIIEYSQEESLEVLTENVINPTMQRMQELENRMVIEQLSKNEYIELANLYKEESFIKKQRNILEQGFLL